MERIARVHGHNPNQLFCLEQVQIDHIHKICHVCSILNNNCNESQVEEHTEEQENEE